MTERRTEIGSEGGAVSGVTDGVGPRDRGTPCCVVPTGRALGGALPGKSFALTVTGLPAQAMRRLPVTPGDVVLLTTPGVHRALGEGSRWAELLTDRLGEPRRPVELGYELSRLAGSVPQDLALLAVRVRPGN